MAKLIWTEPALGDLDAIADYVALDKPEAARQLVQRVFQHVEQLIAQPDSGSRPRELRRSRYRQIVEAPCRIFYRYDGERVFILSVMRGEMRFRKTNLVHRDKQMRQKT
jgi:plasmid stabilization system protein ParE